MMDDPRPGWCLGVGRSSPHYVTEIVPNGDGLALCPSCRLRFERETGR